MDITAAKSLQSCPTLCDPIDRSPPGSPVPGILQARTLEWVVTSFSNARKWKVKGKSSLSRVQLLATPWTTAYQAPLSTGFSRREYWSGVPLPSPMFTLQSFTKKVGWPLLQMIPPSHSITAISVVLICNRAHFPSFPWAEGLVPNSNSDISRDENSEITGYQLITKN